MRDFTLKTYHLLLSALKDNGYQFQTFRDFIKSPAFRSVILRHDVDARKMNSLRTAKLENELGIRGTYYFRIVPESFDVEVIRQIYEMGHEVGYHYEDVSTMAERQKAEGRRKGLFGSEHSLRSETTKSRITGSQSSEEIELELIRRAIESFKENLEKLRRIVPVETVCMHGSPLSRWDNRLLWKYYDYRDFGIVGEPYFDTDFNEVLYLTDTGRRWDGGAVAIRDKAEGGRRKAEGDTPSAFSLQPSACIHSSFDIIAAARANSLPDKIMLTVHPQRWDDRPFPWIKELVWQNVKNVIKGVVAGKMKR